MELNMIEEELDKLFDQVDDLLLDGKFEIVNNMFLVPNIRNKDVSWVLTLLTVTLPAKSQLTNRHKFYQEAETWFGLRMTKGLE